MPDVPLVGSACNAAVESCERLCFFSHFDLDNRVDDYVLHYLEQLAAAGFVTVFVTTSRLGPVEMGKLHRLCADIIERPNFGLDFAGWIACFERYPNVQAKYLLLCNDSVYGPFWSLADFIQSLISVPADFYGAVFTLRPFPHLQSWFLLLTPSAYRSAPFRALLAAPITPTTTKNEIIERFEMGLTAGLAKAGLTYRAGFDTRVLGGPVLSLYPVDPSYTLWRELLVGGHVPFIKIALLRERPLSIAGVGDWQAVTGALNPTVTDMAAHNLTRRLRHHKRSAGRRVRELLLLPLLPLAHLPPARRVLAREVQAGSHARSPGLAYLLGGFVFALVRAPYAWLYRLVRALRRRI